MLSFNPDATLLFNVGIDLFSSIVILIIYYSGKRNFADTYDGRLLHRIELSVLLLLQTDLAMWLLNGRKGEIFRFLGYADNMAYFILQIIAALCWLRYAWHRIFGRNMSRTAELWCVFLPLAAWSLAILTAPLNGWGFYLDSANIYHRGVLSTPMFVVILAYLLAASVVAILQGRKEALFDRRRELQTIAFFAVPPFLGGALQIELYGLSLVWPCVTISCLMILHNQEALAISQDPLTGLNNRRNTERYLEICVDEGPVALIMLDINDFKQINDQYGHDAGDLALITVANILRTTFNGTPAFLARYGGDEFVVVFPGGERRDAERAAQEIRDGFAGIRKEQLPFQLSVSVGCALSDEQPQSQIAMLVKRADEDMYREKNLYHQKRQKPI